MTARVATFELTSLGSDVDGFRLGAVGRLVIGAAAGAITAGPDRVGQMLAIMLSPNAIAAGRGVIQ